MVHLGLPTRLKSHNGKDADANQPESRGASPGRSPIEPKGLVLKTKVLKVRRLATGHVCFHCPADR